MIEIAWAGICHSDVHTVRGDCGAQQYPWAVGHEIVGIVTEVGSEVSRYKVGNRVGVGCMVSTYGAEDRDGSITQGGYSTHVVVDENFVLRIPESIPFDKAAPLLCAGITLYPPLRPWDARPGKRVAIVGLGGLGHMGVKIAHAMGAEVTVLSQTLRKRMTASLWAGTAVGGSVWPRPPVLSLRKKRC